MRTAVSLALLLATVGACSSAGSTPPSGPASGPNSAVPSRILADIVADAAQRAGVDAGGVSVVNATPRTWSDGSLGCPQPGMYYTQVLVDGYQVVVSAGGREYDYRAGGGRFRLCERGASTP